MRGQMMFDWYYGYTKNGFKFEKNKKKQKCMNGLMLLLYTNFTSIINVIGILSITITLSS